MQVDTKINYWIVGNTELTEPTIEGIIKDIYRARTKAKCKIRNKFYKGEEIIYELTGVLCHPHTNIVYIECNVNGKAVKHILTESNIHKYIRNKVISYTKD